MQKKLFSVSLFFRQITENGNTRSTKERLVAEIILAENKFEAFGIAYTNNKANFLSYDLVYDLTLENKLNVGNTDSSFSKPTKICENKVDGQCPLHNVHCTYPDCEK